MRSLQPTASKAALLLKCQRPFWQDPEEENEPETPREPPSPEAYYGIEFHYWMKTVAEGGAWPIVGHPLREHVSRSAKALKEWMAPEGNIWGRKLLPGRAEQPNILNVRPGGKTAIDYDYQPESHTYSLKFSHDVGLTPDLVLIAGPHLVILDYKTGRYESDPAEDPQLLTLALAFSAKGVAVMATPPDAEPMMIQSDVSADRLEQHRKDLRRSLLRRGPAMNPGPHCDEQYCPRRAVCPAYAGSSLVSAAQTAQMALARGQGPFDLLPSVDPGVFHGFLGDLAKLVEWGRAELKERVRAGEVIETRDGKVLTITERTRRSLPSLGELEKKHPLILQALEEAGLVRETTYEEMRAK